MLNNVEHVECRKSATIIMIIVSPTSRSATDVRAASAPSVSDCSSDVRHLVSTPV